MRRRREISKDLRLAKEINALCMCLTAIVDDIEFFADELDMLAGKHVPYKMAEFTKQRSFANFSRFMLASFWSFVRSAIVAWVDGESGLGYVVVPMSKPSFLLATIQRDDEEIGEDLARVREYKGVVFGLNIAMRRKEECIGELKALGDRKDVIKTMRFIERLQQNDMEKLDRSLLLMRVIEVKTREKSRYLEWEEDRNIAIKLNRLLEEMLIICEKRRNLTDKLRSIRGIVVVQKAAKFMADIIRKDNVWVAQLREVQSQMEFKALEKELHVQKITGNIPY
uniref:Uncharacterized protein n=1 Tax=Tanacetum cinerariifolium TaxID=118510 RepID=A0A699J766_TANCI|nr:hypothetical protein [Tanacetum cinerariifolium]